MNYLQAFYATLGTSRVPFADRNIALTNFGQHVGRSTYTFEFELQTTAVSGEGFAFYTQVGGGGGDRFAAHIPFGDQVYFDSGNIGGGGRSNYVWGGKRDAVRHFAHVANFEAGTREIYEDGQLVYRRTGVPYAPYVGDSTQQDDLYLLVHQGRMRNVRYWTVARTAAQIAQSARTRILAPQPGLFGNWHCTEAGEVGTRIVDYSGNANHGVKIN